MRSPFQAKKVGIPGLGWLQLDGGSLMARCSLGLERGGGFQMKCSLGALWGGAAVRTVQGKLVQLLDNM